MGFNGKNIQSWEDYAEELEEKLTQEKKENTEAKKPEEKKEAN